MRVAVLVALVGGLGAACADEGDDDSGTLDSSGRGPQPNEDHWHSAFGIYVCDEFLPALPESESPYGIHTHGDEVVHVHPFQDEGSGTDATLGVFLDDTSVVLHEGHLGVDEEEWGDGDECDGEPGTVQIAWWDDANTVDDTEPTIVTKDFDDLRFTGDGQAFTIAFVPEGTEIPPPLTVDDLDALGALDAASPDIEVDLGGTTTLP